MPGDISDGELGKCTEVKVLHRQFQHMQISRTKKANAKLPAR
jgi:hypothetical protein